MDVWVGQVRRRGASSNALTIIRRPKRCHSGSNAHTLLDSVHLKVSMSLPVLNNASSNSVRPESPDNAAGASETPTVFSPILDHADYSPGRPESPEYTTVDSETVTPDHGIQQQPSGTPHHQPPALTPAAWGIGWECPAMMVGFMISGALLALGHHLYYHTLNGTRVTSIEQQTWATRIGTGLAFVSRAFLVTAVGVAAARETWSTLRNKSIRLYGINSMFNVLNSPMAFFSLDLWRHAKSLTVLAIFSWCVRCSNVFTLWCNFSPSSQTHPDHSGHHPRRPVC
jgi:hypothetical protein